MRSISLFSQFFKIAFFTLGGGYAILPVMRNHFVIKTMLIEEEEFQEYLSLVQGMPGSLAVNCATFIGYRLKGAKGAVVAVLGSVMPSFVVISTISYFFTKIGEHPVVMRFFMGIRPAVVALILYFAFTMARKMNWNPMKVVLMILFFTLFLLFRINPIILILIGVTLGLGYSWYVLREVNR
jgi:chromate transporter